MDAKILSRMIQRAQRKVEEHHFESRKHVLQYDDVMNKQREVIYGERRRILEGADLHDTILGFLTETVDEAVDIFCPEIDSAADWDLAGLYDGLEEFDGLDCPRAYETIYNDRSPIGLRKAEELQALLNPENVQSVVACAAANGACHAASQIELAEGKLHIPLNVDQQLST